MRVGGHQVSILHRKFWRIAALTAVGAIGAASDAPAAIFWSDSYPGFSQPVAVPQRRQSSRRHIAKKVQSPQKEATKPQGPLIIAISIEKQTLKIYDANGFFAQTPVSTGMPGHPTPMGVFSVIEKQKMHHSNIYSGAPMPFMQRITWSGVAIHAGVLPGRPASHGCIRMPMAFAVKMYGWTRNGARVVITPGEMTPSSFSHPLLATQKVVPQPVAANETKTNLEKTNLEKTSLDKVNVETANLELKPTIAHDGSVRSVMDDPATSTRLRERTHTADASSMKTPDTMSDATSVRISVRAASNVDAKPEAEKSEAAKPEMEQAVARRDEVASSDDRPVETKPSEAAVSERKLAEADGTERKSEQASVDTVKVETPASESAKAEETKVEAKADEAKIDASVSDAPKSDMPKSDVTDAGVTDAGVTKADVTKADAPKSDTPKPAEKSDDKVKPATDAGVPNLTKDQTRLQDAEKATAKPAPVASAPKRSGQIAVFVSRKDQKLYVRQNLAPLFDVAVTIRPDERPLGTHVFTAQADKEDANVLHWSVVSLPAPSRRTERRDEDERTSRRRKVAGAVEMKPMPVPDSPAEALDRLTIPADAMARIVDLLSTGGSIIVSDQGIAAGETGEGTDFIVSLR
jgi:lipoprotein-anchoring transpeptidase ErfK/SrfK